MRIRINGFDDQKLKLNFFVVEKLSIYLSLGFHEGLPSYMRSLHPSQVIREHPALQNLKFLHYCGSFLPSWIRIRFQPTKMNVDPCGYGPGSEPQQCLKPVSSRASCFNEFRGCVFKMSLFCALLGTLFDFIFFYF
jgi:hypothetical protein